MDNINTTNTLNTSQKESSNVLIYVFVGVVIIGLIWIINNNTSEKFSSQEAKPEMRRRLKNSYSGIPRPSERQQYRQEHTTAHDDVDEHVRRHAIATHQRLNEIESEEHTHLPLAANVPLSRPSPVKPFEPEDNTLVQFAKNTQHIVDAYRPNDVYKQVPNNNGDFYNLTADDRTIALMNQVDPSQNNYDVACNLSNTLSDADKAMVSNYKNKYYNMYGHQISCSSGNGIGNGKLTGCGKKCYANGMSPSKCTTQECRDSMSELNNSADFVSLNQLILEKNNARPCSTCTQGPISSRAIGVQNILDQVTDFDNVSADFMDSQVLSQPQVSGMREAFNNLNKDLQNKDRELTQKKKVSFANVNNFANFNNYVNQNGVLETSVDKLAEIRSDVTNNDTCGLNQYGQTISQVYDNLMKNPYMEYTKSCDISKITGVSNNDISNYDKSGNFGGNYGGDYASV